MLGRVETGERRGRGPGTGFIRAVPKPCPGVCSAGALLWSPTLALVKHQVLPSIENIYVVTAREEALGETDPDLGEVWQMLGC